VLVLAVALALLLRQCRVSNDWELAREIYGETLPISEVLVAKRHFWETDGFGCTYTIIRFDEESAAKLRTNGLAELISSVLTQRKNFPSIEHWQKTAPKMKLSDELRPDPFDCLQELSPSVATEITSSLEASGSWAYIGGGGESKVIMLINPETRLAAVIRHGD